MQTFVFILVVCLFLGGFFVNSKKKKKLPRWGQKSAIKWVLRLRSLISKRIPNKDSKRPVITFILRDIFLWNAKKKMTWFLFSGCISFDKSTCFARVNLCFLYFGVPPTIELNCCILWNRYKALWIFYYSFNIFINKETFVWNLKRERERERSK